MNNQDVVKIINPYHLNEQDLISSLDDILWTTLKTNELFNLTAIKDPDAFIEKMIFDSVLPLKEINIKGKKCIDVGTGAGFPGLPLSIFSNSDIDLLDSNHKKIKYLSDLSISKHYKIHPFVARCEIYCKSHREEYDFAFVRSVAELKILLEIMSPLIKVGGTLVIYKGPNYHQELSDSKKIIKNLDIHLSHVQNEILPSKEQRNILYFIKDKVTSKKYPRDYNKIVK